MRTITAYYNRASYNGFITVNVWDSADDMYPLFWHNKYQGYTLKEVKALVKDKVAQTLGDTKFKFEWRAQK